VVGNGGLVSVYSNLGDDVHSFAKKNAKKPTPALILYAPFWGHLSVFTGRFFLNQKT